MNDNFFVKIFKFRLKWNQVRKHSQNDEGSKKYGKNNHLNVTADIQMEILSLV